MRDGPTPKAPNPGSQRPLFRAPWQALCASIASLSLISSLPAVPLIELIARRDLAGDIDCHGLAFPALDQRLLAQMSVHELLGKFIAAELEQLHVRLCAPIERHGDAPWPGEDIGILDRHVIPDDVG